MHVPHMMVLVTQSAGRAMPWYMAHACAVVLHCALTACMYTAAVTSHMHTAQVCSHTGAEHAAKGSALPPQKGSIMLHSGIPHTLHALLPEYSTHLAKVVSLLVVVSLL
jgi:hypothetical protein